MSEPAPPFSPIGSFQPREEFERRTPRTSAVGSLVLSDEGGLRIRGVQQEVVYAINTLLSRSPSSPSPSPASSTESAHAPRSASVKTSAPSLYPTASIWRAGLVSSQMISGQSGAWQWELAGSPWKRKGAEELASVRLLVAISQVLLQHGWSFGSKMRAGTKKSDHHAWVLLSSDIHASSPAPSSSHVFAISFPKPNVISIIDPPTKLTPTVLAAIRKAASNARGIKAEAWLPSTQRDPGGKSGGGGVYSFKLKGYKPWHGIGFAAGTYDENHPPLLEELLRTLDEEDLTLSISVELRPTSTRRDLWIVTTSPHRRFASISDVVSAGGISRSGTANSRPFASSPQSMDHPPGSWPSSAFPTTGAVHRNVSGSNSSIGSLQSKPVPLLTSGHGGPPPSAYPGLGPHPSPNKRTVGLPSSSSSPSSSPIKRSVGLPSPSPPSSVLPTRAAAVVPFAAATKGPASVQQPTPMPFSLVPIKVDDGPEIAAHEDSRFAEGRDSRASMDTTATTSLYYIDVEDIQPDASRATEVTLLDSTRATVGSNDSLGSHRHAVNSWNPILEPVPPEVLERSSSRSSSMRRRQPALVQVNALDQRKGASIFAGEN